jgi:hypothetical protein
MHDDAELHDQPPGAANGTMVRVGCKRLEQVKEALICSFPRAAAGLLLQSVLPLLLSIVRRGSQHQGASCYCRESR